MSNIKWVALRTLAQHRAEFRAERAIQQAEFPAMLPFEFVYEKRPGKSKPVKQKYALFQRYVFAGLRDVDADYDRLRYGNPKMGIPGIPEIVGIVCRTRDAWSPFVLSTKDVEMIRSIVDKSAEMTEVDLHKALRPGKRIHVEIGGNTQETVIDEVTKKGVKALLKILGDMPISVEVPFDKVRAA